MKRNDSGDFSVFYIEPGDDKATLFQVIATQKKPLVLMLAEQAHVFQRPDDFTTLKHVKRQLDLPVVFVIPNSGHLAQLAARNGFPVYLSMDALADALSAGQMVRQRSARPTIPLTPGGGLQRPASDGQQATPRNGMQSLPENGKQPASMHGMQRPAIDVRQATPRNGMLRIAQGDRQVTPLEGMRQLPKEEVKRTFIPKKTVPLPLLEDEVVRKRTEPLPPFTAFVASPPSPPLLETPGPVRSVPFKAPRRPFPLLLVILTITIIVAGVGFFLIQAHTISTNTAVPPVIEGHVAFTSSEQLSENSSQGIADQVVVDLNSIPNPAAHNNYYAWLLGDKSQSDPQALALGVLKANDGHAHIFYPGDAQHTNLLLTMSRFLVTEEDAAVMPISPSPDQSTWRYYAEFSSTPINSPDNPKHFSYLDHLRHLLAADPTLEQLELPGGLNNWLYRNTGKLLEWVSSLREQWEDTKDVGYVRRATTRTLEYLDGTSFTYLDLPAGTPMLVNERLARVGLLDVNGANQEPPSYLNHVINHLTGLLQAGGNTPGLRKNASDLVTAMNNVQSWLVMLRQNCQQIMKLTDDQLTQPSTLTLINNMIDNATHAYTGGLDPNTDTMREGVIWIHDHMQALATLDVSRFSANTSNSPHQMIPNTHHFSAFVPNGAKK